MNTPKIQWKVEPAPTGLSRSFQARGWPGAHYANDRQDPCAFIHCTENYTPSRAKEGAHPPLKVRMADHSVSPFEWRGLAGTFTTLALAKAAVAEFVANNPGWVARPDPVKPPVARAFNVIVLATAENGEAFTMGSAIVKAFSKKEANQKARDLLWDDRLDGTCCRASFRSEKIK